MIIHRDLKVARRLVQWLVAISVFADCAVYPANADLIYIESVPVEQIAFTIDYQLTSTDWLFRGCPSGSAGCGAPTTRDETPSRPASPEAPPEPLNSETPFVGLGTPIPSNGTGADSESSAGGASSSVTTAILCCVSDLPQPTLVGCFYASPVLDIPLAPPVEMLRPPQLFTILV